MTHKEYLTDDFVHLGVPVTATLWAQIGPDLIALLTYRASLPAQRAKPAQGKGEVMAKFRKKPVVIEAMQLKRDNLKAIETFLAGREMPDLYQKLGGWDINWGNSEVTISTLEGKMKARPGDWIIKGVKGEFYPCKPDIFEATYEPA